MAYTPTQWNTGDDVTATKLNKLEQGVANAGSALIVTSTLVNGTRTMDKTVQEIYDALAGGTPVYYSYVDGTLSDYSGNRFLTPIVCIYNYDTTSVIRVMVQSTSLYHVTSSTSKSYCYTTAFDIFQASGVNEYPTYYCKVVPSDSVTQ